MSSTVGILMLIFSVTQFVHCKEVSTIGSVLLAVEYEKDKK